MSLLCMARSHTVSKCLAFLLCVSARTAVTLAVPQAQEADWPLLIPLTRESIPVLRNNQVVAHKTSYSGEIAMGTPAQAFRVVFDTGSGHIVLPSSDCTNESCVVHNQFNIAKSETATHINLDGTTVLYDQTCDQVTVGYGTGKITGEFARDVACLGGSNATCVNVSFVMAVQMTTQPFKSFQFDGIFGLSLEGLTVSEEFNFLGRMAYADSNAAQQFGVFLAGENHSSEIALGGFNPSRLLTPLQWAPVAQRRQGYWQVHISKVLIGNRTLDLCGDGSCRGVVDTGTSHIGVPKQHLEDFAQSLSVESGGQSDCREAPGPTLQLELSNGVTLSLDPHNYMRPLALPSGVAIGKQGGLVDAGAPESASGLRGSRSTRLCTPRLMPVALPAPLGPNLFILGEPVLHRYYSVFDWKSGQVGFGLAATVENSKLLLSKAIEEEDGLEEPGVLSLMQVTVTFIVRKA